jgi:hypothetical protein
MLTQLDALKSRLALTDTQYDTLLTNTLTALGERFDRECGRVLARTVDATEEFDAADTEITTACYPIESVSKFELKTNEEAGWIEQPGVEFLVRRNCVISLAFPLCSQLSSIISQPALARVTYTGGYVLPGAAPGAGQTALPGDLEQAAVEQAAYWFQNRDHLGVIREWPKGGVYEQFVDLDLLPGVRAVLAKHKRMVC